MTVPPYLKVLGDVVYLALKVQPRASRNEIGGIVGAELKVKVTAPPVDSAANEAVLELIAAHLNCGRNAVQIVRGATSRHKMLVVRGVPLERIIKAFAS